MGTGTISHAPIPNSSICQLAGNTWLKAKMPMAAGKASKAPQENTRAHRDDIDCPPASAFV